MYTELKNAIIVLQDSANLGKEILFTFCEWFANSTVEETAGHVNLQG